MKALQNSKFNKILLAIIVIFMVIAIFASFNINNIAYAVSLDSYIYKNSWHLNEKSLNATKLYNEIKRKTGKDVLTISSDTIVAVIDSGVDSSNPFLSGSIWQNEKEIAGNNVDDDKNGVVDDTNGANFVDKIYESDWQNNKLGTNDYFDCMSGGNSGQYWHGTHVAGIVHSVAPNVKIMPIRAGQKQNDGNKFYAGFSSIDLVESVIYAVENGADVINMSLRSKSIGFVDVKHAVKIKQNDEFVEKSMSLQDAINYAYSKGCAVVVATGNDGFSKPTYPASCENVISVMASNKDNKLWVNSNYNDTYDVVAPGENILSSIGNNIAGNESTDGNLATSGYGYKNGTSMASPYVAGVVALLHSVIDNINATDLVPIVTDKQLLSSVVIPMLVDAQKNDDGNRNLLLDYNAIIKMLNKALNVEPEVLPEEEDSVATKKLEVFDNNTITLKASKNYDGNFAWYKDGKFVSDAKTYTFYPKQDSVIELKVDGIAVEKFEIKVKSYDEYLMVILSSVIGAVVGVVLLAIIIVFMVKKAKNKGK